MNRMAGDHQGNYGKSRHHPDGGGCLSYALALDWRELLSSKGDDF